MPKKKPKEQEPPKGPPSLQDMPTRELLKSIRDDLAQSAKDAGLDQSEHPPKPRPKR
jgi:hypothetical protein